MKIDEFKIYQLKDLEICDLFILVSDIKTRIKLDFFLDEVQFYFKSYAIEEDGEIRILAKNFEGDIKKFYPQTKVVKVSYISKYTYLHINIFKSKEFIEKLIKLRKRSKGKA